MVTTMSKSKKDRQRLKRQDKLRQRHRLQAVSPYRRIGTSGQVEACYITSAWRKSGMASIFCLITAPDGGHALACFLVDIWCMGLKDTWGRLDFKTGEFKDLIARHDIEDIELTRVDVELVRQLVAGGIRFAKQNGFRLPKKYDRWVTLLGDVCDPDTASLSDFGIEGGRLRFVGPMKQLHQRLIGCPVEEFLSRPDVEYIAEANMFPDDEDGYSSADEESMDTFDVVEESCNLVTEHVLNSVREWCFATGRIPHPFIEDAVELLLATLLQAELPEADELSIEDGQAANKAMDRLINLEPQEDREPLREACEQLKAYAMQTESPGGFSEALKLIGKPKEK